MKNFNKNSNTKGNTMNILKRNHIGFGILALVLISMLITGCGSGNNQTTQQAPQNGVFNQPSNPAIQQQMQQAQAPQGQPVSNMAQARQPQMQQRTQNNMAAPQFNPQGQGQSSLTFTRFYEPTVRSFSVDVPQGWHASGRTVDKKHEVSVLSPDSWVAVQSGDVSLPTFMEPNAMAQHTPPGQCAHVYGVCVEIRPFMSGVQFATDYVSRNTGGVCQNLTFTGQRQRQDWEQMMNKMFRVDAYNQPGSGIQVSFSAGEVDFTCTVNGQPIQGSYLAVMNLNRMSDGYGTNMAIWNAYMILGYAAPPNRVNEAKTVLDRLVNTFQFEQNWLNAQNRASQQNFQQQQRNHQQRQQAFQQQQQIINSTNESINNSITSTYDTYNNSWDESNRHFSNYIRDTTDVYNPNTGETWNVESGSNSYWYDPTYDNIYGSNSYDSPDAWYDPLYEY